jgi:hypothetical protein
MACARASGQTELPGQERQHDQKRREAEERHREPVSATSARAPRWPAGRPRRFLRSSRDPLKRRRRVAHRDRQSSLLPLEPPSSPTVGALPLVLVLTGVPCKGPDEEPDPGPS